MGKSMMTRGLSALLAVSMIVGALPVSSLAAGAGPGLTVKKTEVSWEQLKERLTQYKACWDEPGHAGSVSSTMARTALLGNGDVGVNTSGSAGEMTYLISKGDFWSCGNLDSEHVSGAHVNKVAPLSVGGLTLREPRVKETTPIEPEYKATVTGCGEIIDPAGENWNCLLKGIIDDKLDKNDPNTAWACNATQHKESDPDKTRHWFQVDFGETRVLKKYELYHQGGYSGQSEMNTVDFEVELSVDGQKYETLQKVTDNTEDITKLELSEAKEARYVKVTITNPCNRPGQPSDKTARIGEMRFYDDRNVNLITGEQEESEEPEGKGTVTGCGEIVDADPTWSYLLKGIIDGKMDADNTTWACNGKTHKDDDTEKESQHWFQVDFGEKLPLKKCILFHHGALNGGKTMTTSDYKVEVSADGTNYETVEEVKDNTKNITKHELNTVEEVQYVRVTITKANAEKDTTGRMRELLFLDENSVNLLTGELVEDYINDFSEELDITDGVVKTDVAGIPVRCSSWVAATDNVMVTEVTSLSDKPIELEGAVWTRTDVEEYPRDTGVEGDQIWASKKSANKVENQNEQSWTSEVQVRAKALGTEVKAAENSEA